MSSFTKFDASVMMQYDAYASKLLRGDHWRIMSGFTYRVGVETSALSVTVKRNYISDFASVPWFVRWLVPRHGAHGQAAVLHDLLCETLEITRTYRGKEPVAVPITRKDADGIFYEALKVSGVSPSRRAMIRIGVDGYRILTATTRKQVNRRKLMIQAEYDAADAVAGVVVTAEGVLLV